MKCLATISIGVFALLGSQLRAGTYYVDWASGRDSNNGTSTSAPWQHAPGMQGCANTCSSTTINAGDSIILKGGSTWPAAAFPWNPFAAGSQFQPTSSANIYIGVDKSWYNTAACQQVLGVSISNPGTGFTSDLVTVSFNGGGGSGANGYALRNSSGGLSSVVMLNRGSGYTSQPTAVFSGGGGSGATGTVTVNSGWCRPIFDMGGTVLDDGAGRADVIDLWIPYTTLDNFEVVHVANMVNSAGACRSVGFCPPNVVDLLGGLGPTASQGDIISNFYVHGWVTPYFCYGTGDIAQGSSTITNFVPIYCPAGFGSASWIFPDIRVQVYPQSSYWTATQGEVTVTGISGSNPYTINTNSQVNNSAACNTCNVVVAYDGLQVFAGDAGGNYNAFVTNNVVDGSDVDIIYQQNPYPDCGLSVGNNGLCVAPVIFASQGPGYFTNNVVRFVGNVFFGGCSIIAGNLVEYIRDPADPTGHGNGWECLQDNFGGSLIYNNLFHHWSKPNPNAPGGRFGIGVTVALRPNSSQHDYVFNNVIDDTTTNYFWQLATPTAGTNGAVDLFNNSGACGLSWDLSGNCINAVSGMTITSTNENYVTTGAAFDSGVITNSSVVWTPAQATAAGATSNETYIYRAPNSTCSGITPCTIGTGVSIVSLCNAVGTMYAPALAACLSDTSYGPSYDPFQQVAKAGARAVLTRPVNPDVGAYQLNGGVLPQPPTLLSSTVH